MNIIPLDPEKSEPRKERQAFTAEEWNLLEKTQVTQEDKAKRLQQLLLDPTKEIAGQERDRLTQSIGKMNIAQEIRLALVSNPNSPLSPAVKPLGHLLDRDLQNVSRSENVSYVLARSAARLLFKRKG